MTRQRKQRARNIDKISETYFTPRNIGSFGGRDRLQKQLQNKVTAKDVNRWLATADSYSLHKPARKSFARRKFITSGINQLWQADLADMVNVAKGNDNHKYILMVIDVFSKKLHSEPIKNKSAESVTDAFRKILSTQSDPPSNLQTDEGKEFFNRTFKALMLENKINHYHTYNRETKASVIERAIRTIKQRIYRYFTHSNTSRYVDILPDIVSSYNNSKHNTLGIAPNQVNQQNQEVVWQTIYTKDDPLTLNKKSHLLPGQRVRISKYSTVFAKSYLPVWSEEIFYIHSVKETTPIVYTLSDDNDDLLQGTFYREELQPVTVKDNVYKIEKIVSTRKVGGKTQHLIRWSGYSSDFDSWIDKKDMINDYKN